MYQLRTRNMLVSKDNDEVMTVSLAGGQEVMGRLTTEDGAQYLTKAMTLQGTTQGIAMVKWPATGDNSKVWINKDQIVAMAPAVKELADKYIEATTGIVV